MDCVNLNTSNLHQGDVDAVNDLKKKVIHEYYTLLSYIEKGYRLDYQFILEEINLIEMLQDADMHSYPSLFVLQFYLNNKWETTLS